MKKSEIKINSEYAYSSYDHGLRDRALVLGEARIKQGYGYGSKTISGSRIQLLDRRTGAPLKKRNASTGEETLWIIEVANRTLREDWAPYWAAQVAANQQRLAHANRVADDRDARSRVLLDLIPALREAGYEDDDIEVRDDLVLKALEAHIEDCIEERESRYRSDRVETHLVAPLSKGLLAYVDSGKAVPVPATDLLRILQRGNIR